MIGPLESVLDYTGPTGEEYYLLINAWDNVSFIGNGGSRDRSLDGFFGGGFQAREGPYALRDYTFASTSWLSNLFMIPSLASHGVEAGSTDVGIAIHVSHGGQAGSAEDRLVGNGRGSGMLSLAGGGRSGSAVGDHGRALHQLGRTGESAVVLDQSPLSKISTWESHTLTPESRQSWFLTMSSIYDVVPNHVLGQFFRIPGMYDFLLNTYSDDSDYERISKESRLIYPARHSLKDVLTSLILRVPVYANGLELGWFNAKNFEEIYSSGGPNLVDLYSRKTYTYGVLSPAKVRRQTRTETHWVHVFHIPGVDLESGNTQDWSELVRTPTNEDGVFDKEMFVYRYAARVSELILLIQQAIVETSDILVRDHPGLNELNVRIPGIGLGGFLHGLPDQDLVRRCRLQFYIALGQLFGKSDAKILEGASADVLNKLSVGGFKINLTYVAYSSGEMPILTHADRDALRPLFSRGTDVKPSIIGPGASVLNYARPVGGQYYLLVNAWNNFSFIGNGGSRDRSLDGFFGGGIQADSYTFAATCWLSNLFMNPSLVKHGVVVNTESL